MPQSTPWRELVLPNLRSVAESAHALGAKHLPGGSLSAVVIRFAADAWGPRQSVWQFQFQAVRRRPIFGSGLAACWVEVCVEPGSVRLLSTGTFGPGQVKELASVPGFEFPPRALDLSAILFDVSDVVRKLKSPGPFGPGAGALVLSTCIYNGRLAWRALQDVPGAGVRTLLLDAGDGRVLFDKTDVCQE